MNDDPSRVIAQANAQNKSSAPGIEYQGSPTTEFSVTANQAGYGGTLVPKKGPLGADPASMMAPPKSNVMSDGHSGGSFTIKAGIFKPVDPAIVRGSMSNVRLLRNNTSPRDNFYGA